MVRETGVTNKFERPAVELFDKRLAHLNARHAAGVVAAGCKTLGSDDFDQVAAVLG